MVKTQWDILALTPGRYTTAHSRSFYAIQMSTANPKQIQQLAINTVNCTSRLRVGNPIYFASDSNLACQTIQEYATTNHYNNLHTTAINSKINENPLHLDFAGRGNKTWTVHAFYDIFVDILVLGNSECVAFDKGGYGAFAALLSFDYNCSYWTYDEIPRLDKRTGNPMINNSTGKTALKQELKTCDRFVVRNAS